MTTQMWVGECVVCQGTGDDGFHGYYGIPAWLSCQCDGGGVILRLHCLTKKNRRKKRGRFSSAVPHLGVQYRIHLPGDPVPLLEESLGVHLHTEAPHQC